MKILAIETSSEHGSIALLVDDCVLDRALCGQPNHSVHLLPAVHGLLAEAQVGLRTLDAIAFGSGPGAFTGLRLACAVAQGLALGAGLPVAPVCSLAALAMQAGSGRILAATDARMGEIYYASFQRSAQGLDELAAPACVGAGEFVPPAGVWHVLGSAFSAYPELIERFGSAALTMRPEAIPRAADVARLAMWQASAGTLVAPELATPLYVRDKVALTTAERLARGGRA